MPKIEVSERTLFGLLGRRLERKELEELLPAAKAELDEWAGGVPSTPSSPPPAPLETPAAARW
jgi:hypothetical protein